MLLELNIENFAIIDKINISFTKGFNVLTGETGTGKSIIIDAISMVLGGRATKEYIRTGSEKSVIEALFYLDNPQEVSSILREYGIDGEEDNSLLITREIYASGRSTSRVNGRTVTLNMLNDLTHRLIDIHGQHEHQSLLTWENHMRFIDSLGNEKSYKLKEDVSKEYNSLSTLRGRLAKYSNNDEDREKRIDFLKFQLEEINSAQLKVEEEEELLNQYNLMFNTEEIIGTLGKAVEKLNSSEYGETSVIDHLSNVYAMLQKVGRYDKNLVTYSTSVESIVFQIQDIARELRSYEEAIEYDGEKLKQLEERINLINRLKRKYNMSIDEILQYQQELTADLEFILNSEVEINRIKDEIEKIEESLTRKCENLSHERLRIAEIMEKDITTELQELNMSNVTFKVEFKRLESFTRNGFDRIEFMISTNPGEPIKPLSKVISGGEMSRIMLAFKSILAEVDNISCLIFDEIDTGISGRTAQVVGEKMNKISRNHQVLCITHLPQIAAMSDGHFMIEKIVNENKTSTKITKLDYNERIEELSRLLGGVSLTDTTKMHAREMLDMSEKLK